MTVNNRRPPAEGSRLVPIAMLRNMVIASLALVFVTLAMVVLSAM